ncbi:MULTISPECIES: type VII secretion-associated serine protease mycosin [unclassified Streptomyces]|uniref:type VII secretion-associated serine protease mycosin n=1 Tax=unclassified Streptomyces TaxID=2593676 RepID=UPI00203478C5|nr:type VII secretion-associated serine protease mycosin [Streptomyces sp. RKAG290]MCM2415142.1 type VII secretion-associated serine protease mycosin [Streptomyces sp. RKAG290]
MTPRARRRRVLGAVCAATAFVLLPASPARADTIRAQQWGLDALHTETAWQTTRGKGITVAVVDTGVDGSLPDLAGQVLQGKDMIGFGAGRGDRSWARHGTAMAGIIAGRGHGTGREDGVLGIAPEAKILPVRVILEATDPSRSKARKSRATALADGIRWAADHGADVINLSLGDDSESAHPEPGEDAAVQYALKKGAVVVASAGNGGEKGDHVSYPAAYPGVIAAAAVDRYGTHASFSTRHWYTSVSAPGDGIVVPAPDGQYYVEWGTSAAAAFVSGAVALVRAAHPGLPPAQIKKLLTDTARNSPSAGRDDARGYGLVDPAAAIKAGGKLRPAGLRADAGAAGYRKQYFGTGPTPPRKDDGPAGWLAPAAGGLGAVLLALAVVLWRGRGRTAGPRR